MITLLDRVRRTIERQALLPAGSRVLVAVSGGADSVALLHVLRALEHDRGVTVAGMIHVNHGLRGAESDTDEAFCRDLAQRVAVPVDVSRVDVAALSRAEHMSLEAAGRWARYRAFEDAARRVGAGIVATGHTRDDQAETLLMRLLRGAGSSGLAGIRARRDGFIRPLLDVRHQELLTYLAEIGESHREDASNRDIVIPRNWIRHELLPLLADHIDADVVPILARDAAILGDDDDYLDQLATGASPEVIEKLGPGAISLDRTALNRLPPALARRVVRTALLAVNGQHFVGFDHIERVRHMARDPSAPPSIDLPRLHVERKATAVVLSSRAGRAPDRLPAFRYALPVPGSVIIPECHALIESRVVAADPSQYADNTWVITPGLAAIDAGAAAGGLVVRSRHPGDALKPLGLSGRKKVQDILVDRKVPRLERDRIPIVVDGNDRVLWVAGHVVAEAARVTDRTQSVVVLELRGQGESS